MLIGQRKDGNTIYDGDTPYQIDDTTDVTKVWFRFENQATTWVKRINISDHNKSERVKGAWADRATLTGWTELAPGARK